MVTYHRWMLLPMEEYTDDNGRTARSPKYVYDEDRLDGFTSGGTFSRQNVRDAGYDHLLAHNGAEKWRVVLLWGEGTDAWNALNEIHANYHDTDTLADHDEDVKPVMEERFGTEEWSVDTSHIDDSQNTA